MRIKAVIPAKGWGTLGESVVKLAQAVEHVIEAIRLGGVEASVTPHPLEWLPGAIATFVFALIALFSLLAASTANKKAQTAIDVAAQKERKQDFLRLKSQLLEDMSSIMEAASTLMTDFDDPNDMTGRNICTKLVNIHKIISVKLIFISNLPITSKYLREYPVSLVEKVFKREREEALLDERESTAIMAFIDNVEAIFLEIAKLTQESFARRLNCENISYTNYEECCPQDIKVKYELLKNAMEKLRKSPPEPYDFSQNVAASPSQPEN